MDAKQASKLREPFPADAIGKLPKVSCGACTNAAKSAGRAADKHCDRHVVRECPVCHNYLTTGHIHLDYVGHAAATARLLDVDPDWTWRPFDGDEISALPPVMREQGLWIMLTVAGVTRPGFGDAQGKTGPNAVKECIGDAIRNAAMRFGMALDLWSKEDISSITSTDEPAIPRREPDVAPQEPPGWEPKPDKPISDATRKALFALMSERGVDDAETQRHAMSRVLGREVETRSTLTEAEGRTLINSLRGQ